MNNYKFLIIGGLHGNEPLGINLVKTLQKLNLPNIKAIYGNPNAIQKNVRFVNQDINRVFPGKPIGGIEEMRAFELMQMCDKFDFVLDFHNTHTPNNDCGFVGGDNYSESLELASFLELDKVIVANYDCINKFVANCLSVEISLSSQKNNTKYWVNNILSLAEFTTEQKHKNLDFFQFKRRVTREEQNICNFTNWKAFKPISAEDKIRLNLDITKDYFPIFVDDKYTSNYSFAALITRIQLD